MGAKSFIVQGLGTSGAFNSCSHGAGRKMSRTAAKKKFTRDESRKTRQSASSAGRTVASSDEIPGAYKDIEKVMRAQEDLVEVVAEG